MLMLRPQNQVEAIPLKVVSKISEIYWLNPFFERPEPEPILREAFNWEEQGIFVAIASVAEESQIELPWEDEDAEILDLAYFGNHSGGKFCAPVVKLLLQTESFVDENGQLNEDGTEKLAEILLRKYYTNWKSLWVTNTAVYDPIHNYDMLETRHLIGANSETVKDEFSGNDSTEDSRDTTNIDYRYGLNTVSTDVKPSEKSVMSDSGSSSTDRESTDARNTVAGNEESEELHRAGNIGVTTTQKLIQEERELWLWNYFDQIFKDIDRELALAYHDPCRV